VSKPANKRDGSYSLSIGAALSGIVCLVLTGIILHTFGKSIGTTADGKALLSWGAVAVHVIGLVVMGLLFGYFRKRRNWSWAIPCGLIMISAAGFTFTNLYGFASAERISATKAVEAAKQRTDKAEKERLTLAKQRQEAQERLAKSQLGFMQAEVEDARGKARKQLSKDFAKNSATIIAEIGKEAPAAAPAPKAEAELSPDEGAVQIAELTGISQQAVQTGYAMWLAKLLIALELFLWPCASFTWPSRRSDIIDVDYNHIPAQPLVTEPARGPEQGLLPPAQMAIEAPIISQPGPAPESPAQADPFPVTSTARLPLPGSVSSLDAIGFPLHQRPDRRRDKSQPREAAQRFAVWLRAFDLVREPLTDEDITKLYAEFCEDDYRQPTAENLMRGELKNLRGVDWGKPRTKGDDGEIKRPTRWLISRGKYSLPPTPTKQEGNVLAYPRPLAVPARDEPEPMQWAA